MARDDDSLETAIAAGVDALLYYIHTLLRGNVVSYDEATKTCEVKIGTKVPIPDDDGNTIFKAVPNLLNVPVAWPSAGGFMLHWPLPAGSSVFVTFDEQDSQRWEASGEVSEPGWLERFGLSSPLAHPYSRVPIATNGAGMPCPSPFSFGDPAAAKAVAIAQKVETELDKIAATLITGSNSGGSVVFDTPYAAPTAGITAAEKLKSE